VLTTVLLYSMVLDCGCAPPLSVEWLTGGIMPRIGSYSACQKCDHLMGHCQAAINLVFKVIHKQRRYNKTENYMRG
jgi:hypothetical protein